MNGQHDAQTILALVGVIAVGTLFTLAMVLSFIAMMHIAMSGGRVVGMGRAITAMLLSFVGPGLLFPLMLLGSGTGLNGTSGRIRFGPFEKILNRTSQKLGPFVYSIEGEAAKAPLTVEFVTKSTITGETEADAYHSIAERMKDRGVAVDVDSFEMRFDGFAVRVARTGDDAPSTGDLLKAARKAIDEMVADEAIPKDSITISAVREHAR